MANEEPLELDRRSVLAGAAAAGAALAAPALAQDKGAVKDPALESADITYKSGEATINAFHIRPKGKKKLGYVLVAPDIFGMTPYIRETSAQIAQAGLGVLCVDFYSRVGGSIKTDDFAQLRGLAGKLKDEEVIADFLAGVAYLEEQKLATGKYGITGFCMGGRITLLVAASSPKVVAASPYYGPVLGQPGRLAAMDLTAKIAGAVQGHYGERDMNPKPDDVKAFYAKLAETNKNGEYFIYPGAGHAFHSFTRPSYVKEAAEQAWSRTLAFFQKHLK